MFRKNVKAMMGIETLIIFIATILVAAIASGVLISTSNVLQNRALITAQEARKGLTNAVEIIAVTANMNKSSEDTSSFEILIKLQAGSDPINMRKFDMQLISENYSASAILQHPLMVEGTFLYQGVPSRVNTTTPVSVGDIDGDNINDTVILSTPGGANSGQYEELLFNLSSVSSIDPSDSYSLPISLGKNLSGNVSINIYEEPIVHDQNVYGYVSIFDWNNETNSLKPSINMTVTRFAYTCDVNRLQPETRYCYQISHGNNDVSLEPGERFNILYKWRKEHTLGVGQEFTMLFSAEKGSVTEIRSRTPDVISAAKASLWPLG
jgi:archaellin